MNKDKMEDLLNGVSEFDRPVVIDNNISREELLRRIAESEIKIQEILSRHKKNQDRANAHAPVFSMPKAIK